jgi:heat-inducible transcriptional repressor
VVTDSGRILQEHCRIDEPLSMAEVAGAEQMINHQVVGRELGVALVTEEGVGQAEVVRLLAGAVGHLLSRSGEAMGEVYVGGTGQMTTVWNSLTAIHRVLEVLEREAEVLNLLANASGTSIRIGDELGDLVDMAVVSTTYEGAAGEGSIGVIGPMRMDYKKTISAVERVGQELGDRIGS